MNIDTKIECVKREIKRRKKFYPAYVEQSKMTQRQADNEIAEMQAVYETLTSLKAVVG